MRRAALSWMAAALLAAFAVVPVGAVAKACGQIAGLFLYDGMIEPVLLQQPDRGADLR